MKQLSLKQRELVSSLGKQLGSICGIKAVVLGGSHARGWAQPGSDIDIGILYSEAEPFSIESVRYLAERVNDSAGPVVTDFYGWGRWVNGGAWLTIGGQRVDLIYRSLEHVESVIADAEVGRYELDSSSSLLSDSSAPPISVKSRCPFRYSTRNRASMS